MLERRRHEGTDLRCPSCAKEIRDTAKVCGYCGTKQATSNVTTSGPEPETGAPGPVIDGMGMMAEKRGRPAWMLAVFAGGVLVVVVVALSVVLRGGSDTDPVSTTEAPQTDETTGAGSSDEVVPTEAPPVSSPSGDTALVVGSYRAAWDGNSEVYLFIESLPAAGRVSVTQFDPLHSCYAGETDASMILQNDATFDGEVVVFDTVTTRTCLTPGGEWELQDTASGLADWNLRPSPVNDALIELATELRYFPIDESRQEVVGR